MIRSMGVEFRRSSVGSDVTLEALEGEFSLLFLGLGLGEMQRLGISGEDAQGVVDALHFIERYKTQHDVFVGRRVAVIGGGNTAIDAANAARRLGAEEVHIFYRRTEKEMPAFGFEHEHAVSEGVQFHWNILPLEIVAHKGRATGVRLAQAKVGSPDAGGKRSVIAVPGSESVFACDMVIPALGQTRVFKLLAQTRGIELSAGGVVVDRQTGRTTNPRFYAGGDCVNGGREVVDAVADGKRAAYAMARSLEEARNG